MVSKGFLNSLPPPGPGVNCEIARSSMTEVQPNENKAQQRRLAPLTRPVLPWLDPFGFGIAVSISNNRKRVWARAVLQESKGPTQYQTRPVSKMLIYVFTLHLVPAKKYWERDNPSERHRIGYNEMALASAATDSPIQTTSEINENNLQVRSLRSHSFLFGLRLFPEKKGFEGKEKKDFIFYFLFSERKERCLK